MKALLSMVYMMYLFKIGTSTNIEISSFLVYYVFFTKQKGTIPMDICG